MRIEVTVTLAALSIICSGCTDVGETTQTAAATGGVMGAGLGAIVGSTTGNAGAGMVIGGLAGAASGAAIGNVMQGQEEALRTQDEAIERQEQMIASQRSELDELRRLGQDSVSFRGNNGPRASYGDTSYADNVRRALRYEPRAAAQPQASASAPSYAIPSSAPVAQQQPTIREADLTAGTTAAAAPMAARVAEAQPVRGAYDWDLGRNMPTNTAPSAGADSSAAPSDQPALLHQPAAAKYSLTTPECNQAESEARDAESAQQLSDKLFHIRRALRLCPNEARYHNSLGEVYTSLNRTTDARFEFEQALSLDPNLQAARDNLSALQRKQG